MSFFPSNVPFGLLSSVARHRTARPTQQMLGLCGGALFLMLWSAAPACAETPAPKPTPIPTPVPSSLNDEQRAAKDAGEAARRQGEALLKSLKTFRQESASLVEALKNAKDEAASVLTEEKPPKMDAALLEIEQQKLDRALNDQLKLLGEEASVPQALKKAREDLQRLATHASNEAAKKILTEEISLIEAQEKALKTEQENLLRFADTLRQTLLGARATLAGIAEGVLKTVGQSLPRTDPQRLGKLPDDLWTLRDAFRLETVLRDYYAKRDAQGQEEKTNFRQRISRLMQALPQAPGATKASPPTLDPMVGALDNLRQGVFGKVKALADHYGKVNLYVADRLREINIKSGEFEDARPSSRRIVASQLLVGNVQREAQTLSLALERQDALARTLAGQSELKLSLDRNRLAAESLSKQLDQFENATTLLEELLLGDRSRWVGEQVTLYYFGEVDRLIRALNPRMTSVGELAELQQKAAKARRDLTEAQLNVEDERQKIARLQTRLQEMEAEKGTIQARFKAATERLTGLNRANARLSTRRTNASARLEELREAAVKNPDNPSLKREIKLAEEKVKDLDRQALDESEKLLDAQAAKGEAEGALSAITREDESLPSQIDDAREQLLESQSRMRQLTRDAYLQAQNDLDAFVAARDNRPFLFAPPQPFSTDPVQRVALYGYADSKTLFMRGLPEDIAQVRRLVETFDRPTPQARLTLWTLELNSQADQRSIEKLNRGMAILEERLADARADLLSATALLRHCVNTIANEAASQEQNDGQLARYSFYADEVVKRLCLSGVIPNETSPKEELAFLKANLPDPAATTTFGEALMVLALAKSAHQERVLQMFESELQKQMPEVVKENEHYRKELLTKQGALTQKPGVKTPEKNGRGHVWFSSLRAVLGINFSSASGQSSPAQNSSETNSITKIKAPEQDKTSIQSTNPSHLTAQQTEILRALQRVALQRLTTELDEEFERISAALPTEEQSGQPLREYQLEEIRELERRLKDKLKPKREWINREFPEVDLDFEELRYRIAQIPQNSQLLEGINQKLRAAKEREAETKQISFETTKESQRVNRDLRQKINNASTLVSGVEKQFKNQELLQRLKLAKNKLDTLSSDLQDSAKSQGQVQQVLSDASLETFSPERFEKLNNQALQAEKNAPKTLQEVLNLIDNVLKNTKTEDSKEDLRTLKADLQDAEVTSGVLREKAQKAQNERQSFAQALKALYREQNDAQNAQKKSRSAVVGISQKIAPKLLRRISATSNNARIAAADQMLKELITAAEDDLDRHYVRPLLYRLRDDMKGQGINVGILNRTSVLASNRQVARVDPLASAQLEMGSTTDLLEASRQLATLYSATQVPGVASVVNALDAMPKQENGAIYGVTSGGRFEVTPVIDPSGQALRFKFDYVLQNQLRDPDGTVDPLLPRVSRHTINTEVQLSNLEIRNISQFEASTKLGLPTKYTGGLPIFNDIPGIREIPLIGWFKRRADKAASIQQSIVLAQTTIYPTIGDISGLLVQPNSHTAPIKSKP